MSSEIVETEPDLGPPGKDRLTLVGVPILPERTYWYPEDHLIWLIEAPDEHLSIGYLIRLVKKWKKEGRLDGNRVRPRGRKTGQKNKELPDAERCHAVVDPRFGPRCNKRRCVLRQRNSTGYCWLHQSLVAELFLPPG